MLRREPQQHVIERAAQIVVGFFWCNIHLRHDPELIIAFN
jgi:hypothetical protein